MLGVNGCLRFGTYNYTFLQHQVNDIACEGDGGSDGVGLTDKRLQARCLNFCNGFGFRESDQGV